MVRKEVDGGEGSSEYLLIEPTNWKEERIKGRLKPSAIPPLSITSNNKLDSNKAFGEIPFPSFLYSVKLTLHSAPG